MSLNTIKRVPKMLQASPFWSDFVDIVDEELSNLKLEIDAHKNQFNPRNLTTIAELRTLNEYFGFIVDVSLLEIGVDDVVSYLRRETENITFKVRKKSSKDYHEYMFNKVSQKGYVYVLFYDSQDEGALYRAINYYDSQNNVLSLLEEHDFSVAPFTKVYPLMSFEGFLTLYGLDRNQILDDTTTWELDYSLFGNSVSPTKHIAAEFMTDRVVDTSYLTNDTYLEYALNNLNFGRKATEVPHAGIGVTAYCTDDESEFTIPTISVATQVTTNWTADSRTNLDNLYNYIVLESVLDDQFYKQSLASTQIYEEEDTFDLVNVSFPGNRCNTESAGTGNGSNDDFTYTADFPGVAPHSIIMTYTDVGSEVRTIKDDGNGNLYYSNFVDPEDYTVETDWRCGSVIYSTGVLDFSTVITTGTSPPDVTPGNANSIDLSYRTTYDHTIDTIRIYNSSDQEVLTCTFPWIVLSSSKYHASFLFVIDRRS